jgi:hypothetical protein
MFIWELYEALAVLSGALSLADDGGNGLEERSRWIKKALARRLNLIQVLAPAHHTKSRTPSATRSTAEGMQSATLQMRP